jgi:nucleotide-binding universal stress UspA family protein
MVWTAGQVYCILKRTSSLPTTSYAVNFGRSSHERISSGRRYRLASRIVVPLDRSEVSERALPLARGLSRQLILPVTLVTVLDVPAAFAGYGEGSAPRVDAARIDPVAQRGPHGRWSGWTATEPSMRQLEQVATQTREAEKYLAEIKQTFREVPVEVSVQFGRAEERIIHVAEQRPDSMIVIASHGRSGITRALIGSVASRVVHAATMPVFVVRCSGDGPGRQGESTLASALLPMDGSPLSENAVSKVQEIFGPSGLRMHFLSVIEHPGFEERSRATEYLEALSDRVRATGAEVTWEVTEGFCADEVNRVAAESNADLIVMTARAQAGFNRFIMGSNAERVLQRAERPLLMLRPDESAEELN